MCVCVCVCVGLPLVGSILRVLLYHSEIEENEILQEIHTQSNAGKDVKPKDDQLQALLETTAEFLAEILHTLLKVANPAGMCV